jgi:hypothetical protein
MYVYIDFRLRKSRKWRVNYFGFAYVNALITGSIVHCSRGRMVPSGPTPHTTTIRVQVVLVHKTSENTERDMDLLLRSCLLHDTRTWSTSHHRSQLILYTSAVPGTVRTTTWYALKLSIIQYQRSSVSNLVVPVFVQNSTTNALLLYMYCDTSTLL